MVYRAGTEIEVHFTKNFSFKCIVSRDFYSTTENILHCQWNDIPLNFGSIIFDRGDQIDFHMYLGVIPDFKIKKV